MPVKPQLVVHLNLEAGSYQLIIGPHPTGGRYQVSEKFTGLDGAERSKASVIEASSARDAIVGALADLNVAAAGLLGEMPLTGRSRS